jgi:hypothetical protein
MRTGWSNRANNKNKSLEECCLLLSGFVLISAQWQSQGDDIFTRRIVVTLSSVVMFSVFYDDLFLSLAAFVETKISKWPVVTFQNKLATYHK